MTDNIEILSPAGSLEALKAAVCSGADAVYFGGKALSARRNAVNLSDEEIIEAVSYAHLRGVRLYAAVNTLVFDNELSSAFEFIKFCYEAGVDALIVQDLGLARMIREHFPDYPLHASTQMTVHNLSGVRVAESLGFKRVVLSRELGLEQIRHIAENTDLELEVFVHGALCMSYSGQCLMSSFLGGRSGNRGACAQPCRLCYSLYNSKGELVSPENKYLLSLKDLCLIDHISELKKIGVKSLKIEGRMKSTAYVSAVCGIYNKYRNGRAVSSEDRELLENIFSRGGFTEGHFKDEHGREMLSFDKNHDDIFSKATEAVLDSANAMANLDRRSYIQARFVMKEGEAVYFSANYGGRIFEACGETKAQKASNMPVGKERIREQLSKLGSTVLEYSSLEIDAPEDLYIPIKELNFVRRSVTEKIEKYIIGGGRAYQGRGFELKKYKRQNPAFVSYSASVTNEAQADICYELGFDRIYIPYSLYKRNKSKFDADGDVYSVKLNPVNQAVHADFRDIATKSVCLSNIGQLPLVPKSAELIADYRMNACNTLSLSELKALGFESVCISPELTLGAIRDLSSDIPLEVLAYGKLSLMTLKNCLVKSSLGKCGCFDGELYYLKDRKGICFPVECIKGECINIIYNSAPIYMADRLSELAKTQASYYRFDFTDETPEEISSVMQNYDKGRKADGFFTRGHYYNAVL